MKHSLLFFLLFFSLSAQAQYYPVAANTPYCDAGGVSFLNNDCIQQVNFVDISYALDAASIEVYTDFTMTQETFNEFDQGLAFTTANDNPNWNFFWAPPFSLYQYFTEVEKGATYPINVSAAQTGGWSNNSNRYLKTYVDWNQDGDFDDADELVLTAGPSTNSNNLTFSGNVTVPVTALNGPTVMRVILARTNNVGSFGPCSTLGTGEAEDYTVIVGGLISNVTSVDVSCNGETDGSITVDASGAVQPYSVSIDGGLTYPYTGINASSYTINNLGAGSYNIAVEDATLEEDIYSANPVVINEPAPIILSAGVSSNYNGAQISCFGELDGEITITASGGTLPLSFSYDGGTGAIIALNNIIPGLGAGTYTISVMDANSCPSSSVNVSITEPEELTATVAVSSDFNGAEISCDGASDGEIIITEQGGTPSYTYLLNATVLGSNVAGSLAENTYSVEVEDINGCISPAVAIGLTEPDPVVITTNITSSFNGYEVSCLGSTDGEVTVSTTGGTGAYAYSTTGGAPFSYATNNITALAAGGYTLLATDANSCVSNADPIVLTEPSLLEVAAVNVTSAVSCFGAADAEILITSAGGVPAYNYIITGGAPIVNGATVTALSQGSYSAVVQDINLCESAVFNFTISEPDLLTFSAFIASNYNGEDVSCNGFSDGIIELNPVGGTSPYEYSINAGGNTVLAPTNQITGLSAGAYSITITDVNNCPTATADINLELMEPALLTSASSVSSNYNGQELSCYNATDGAITVQATGGTAPFQFSVGGQPFTTGATPFTATGLGVGNQQVFVQDINGCLSSLETVSIAQTPELILTVLPTNVGCGDAADGSASLNITGGTPSYNYLWSDGQTVMPATGLAPGSYNVVVTDLNGCVNMQNFDITEPSLEITGTNILCFGEANGTLTAVVVNPNTSANYNYLWNDASGQTTATATGLSPGQYQLTVSDQFGCELTATDSISEPEELVAFLEHTYICETDSFSEIMCYPSGGVFPYNYLWSNMSTTTGIDSLTAGNYTVVVTDNNGCLVSQSVEILPVNPIAISYQVFEPTCIDNVDGQIMTVVSGGYPPYEFEWSNGVVEQNNYEVGSGLYSLVVTDQGSCTANPQISVVADGDECIEIYSGFTPNGDLSNDFWHIEGIELYPDALVEIYNRWGDRVFAAKRYNNSWQEAWNGMYKGEPLPSATYYYVINLNNGDPLKKGTVTLIR